MRDLGLLLRWLALLLVLATVPARADVTDVTEKQIKENVRKLNESVKNVQEDVNVLIKDVGEAYGNAGDGLSVSKEAYGELKDVLGEYLDAIGDLSVSDFKSVNTDNLKTKFKEISEKAKSIKGISDDFSARVDALQKDMEMLVERVRNVATVVFTAPVMLRGGSGNSGLEISIDTLKYIRKSPTEGSVAMDVHAGFQLPFSVSPNQGITKLKFRGENIILAGSGPSRIKVDLEKGKSYQKFPIVDGKAWMIVDSTSYLDFDCNGFREMRLKGQFEFCSSVIYPAEASATDTTVAADFDVFISDLEDILIETGINKPFKVRGTGDVVYEVHGLVADMSTARNADGFAFPKGYSQPFVEEDASYWTGFAFKTLKVDVHEELPFVDSLSAYNMLIDETGFSGWFSAAFSFGDEFDDPSMAQNADQVVVGKDKNTKESKKVMTGRITRLAVGIASNKVVDGELNGSLSIKGLGKKKDSNTSKVEPLTVKLDGKLYTESTKEGDELCYDIKAKIAHGEYVIPICKSVDINIGAGTSVQYAKKLNYADSTYSRGFSVNLCGSAGFSESFLKFDGLTFQNLQFSTMAPYFGGGTFSLNGAKEWELGGLSFALMDMSAGYDTTSHLASMGAAIKLKIIGDGNGASVAGKFRMMAKTNNGWKVEGLHVDSISVDLDFSAFHLLGMIAQFDNDAVYGKGFEGHINLGINALDLNVDIAGRFGKRASLVTPNQTFRYWYVSGDVGLPAGVVIFPPAVMLKSVSLAVYSRMNFSLDKNSYSLKKKFTPNENTAFGFIGGIGVYVAQKSLIDAAVQLGMEFNSGGGIKKIRLLGAVYMLASEQKNSMIRGTLDCTYDFENDIFLSDAEVTANLVDVVTGNASMHLYSGPDGWDFDLGTNEKPARLNFAGIAQSKSYFMMGRIPAYLSPLDAKIAKRFNIVQSDATANDNTEMFATGKGFAFAIAVNLNCGVNRFIYANVDVGGGTDALVIRRPGMTCGGSNYRVNGRAYIYMDLGAGVKPRRKKYCIVEFSGDALLEAELPKPYYVGGKVSFRYRVLGGLVSGHATAKFSAGSRCSWNSVGTYEVQNPGFDFSGYENENEKVFEDVENGVGEEYWNESNEENPSSTAPTTDGGN